MSRMPCLKPREVLEILFLHGFTKIRTSGSHVRLRKGNRLVTVAFHSRSDVPKGTLNNIIRQSGIEKEAFAKFRNQ